MPKQIACHSESPGVLQRLIRTFSEWNEAWRAAANAKRHANILQNLNARLQYDVGESDCWPQPKSLFTLQREQSALLEAMRNWSI